MFSERKRRFFQIMQQHFLFFLFLFFFFSPLLSCAVHSFRHRSSQASPASSKTTLQASQNSNITLKNTAMSIILVNRERTHPKTPHKPHKTPSSPNLRKRPSSSNKLHR
ncbi:uncharacterized protein IWZ02DRAFT_441248 [Phyllosticta citriasiana]|uniref:uncharacterized protein n=1 Tax=Phyllosticta citriasiana TaxID=595635 RepID=UPI0030FD42CE